MTPELKFKRSIAGHLKSIRARRKLSLDATAKLTGVSKAMLGQIEREESIPTISKLWQIASGLDTSFSEFLTRFDTQVVPEHQLFADDPNMLVKTIAPFDPNVGFEMFEIELRAFHCQLSQAHAFSVIETIWVLEGEMELLIDGEWKPVKAKECMRFHADQPHGYKAVSEKVLFQNIVHYG